MFVATTRCTSHALLSLFNISLHFVHPKYPKGHGDEGSSSTVNYRCPILQQSLASSESVLESGAQDKKRIYKQAVKDRRGTFTPFVTSVDGLLHREAEHFLKRMATCVASKWKKSYAQTCGYIRARLSFAIIRAASLCLRCSRLKESVEAHQLAICYQSEPSTPAGAQIEEVVH
ncbi:hypothetical protein EMCRGX_G000882 [Ephydatia muelleri]